MMEDYQTAGHHDEASKYEWTGNVGRVTGAASCALLLLLESLHFTVCDKSLGVNLS